MLKNLLLPLPLVLNSLVPNWRVILSRKKTIHGEDPELGTDDKSSLVIIRNTNVHTPNLTINSRSDFSRKELYVVAVFGTVLQFGVLLYSGVATYHPNLSFKKDGRRVADYAFTCVAVGTLLLVAGMILCCHVVESSTTETQYRPVGGREARIVWLQKRGIVSDHTVEPFAVFPTSTRSIITTSVRAQGRKEIFAVVGTAVSLGGYIVQFIGLRGLHWSASVAQLGAIGVMTSLRAWVRRNLAQVPASQPLVADHELDWLAITLGAGPRKAPWVDPTNITGDSQSRPWTENGWDWNPSLIQDQGEYDQLNRRDSAPRSRSAADKVLEARRNLGRIADWPDLASDEALSLAKATELVLNHVDPLLRGSPQRFRWYLVVRGQRVYFTLEKQGRKWKAFSDEIAAALSLWLYSIQAAEKEREGRENIPVDPKPRTSGSIIKETPGTIINRKKRQTLPTLVDDDEAWLRRRERAATSVTWLLGASVPSLCRDIYWWQPEIAARIFHVSEKKQDNDDTDTIDTVAHRSFGFVPREHQKTLSTSRWKASPGNNPRFESRFPPKSRGLLVPAWDTILAVKSAYPLKKRLAQQMLTAFMWATAKELREPITGTVEVRPKDKGSLIEFSVAPLNEISLHSSSLDRMAEVVSLAGMGPPEDAFMSIIPPFSALNKLPRADSIIQYARKRAGNWHENGNQGWQKAFAVYKWMLMVSRSFPPYSSVYCKGHAAMMEFARQVEDIQELQKKLPPNDETRKLPKYPLETVLGHLESTDRTVLAKLLGLYESQRRRWVLPVAVKPRFHFPNAVKPVKPYGRSNLLGLSVEQYYTMVGLTDENIGTYFAPDVPVDHVDVFERSMLHYGAVHGPPKAVWCLLQQGHDINAQDLCGMTPLHLACRYNPDGVVEILLERKPDLRMQDAFGLTPLHVAARHGHERVVRLLLHAKARNNVADLYGNTPLHYAAIWGHRAVVELLSKEPGFNSVNNFTYSAMLLAAYHGHVDSVHVLWNVTDTKADMHRRQAIHLLLLGLDGDTIEGEQRVKRFHHCIGIDPRAKDELHRTPLHIAAKQGLHRVAQLLFNLSGDIFAEDINGCTSLHYAAMNGHTKVAILLLKRGSIVDSKNVKGTTPLHFAAIEGYRDMALLLLDHGADESCITNDGDAPIQFATTHGHVAVVQALLCHGADVNSAGGNQGRKQTPLHIAVRNKHEVLIRHLLRYNPDLELRTNASHRTVLHQACMNDVPATVRSLVKRGAKMEVLDSDQHTPLALAVHGSNVSVIRELLKLGASPRFRYDNGLITPLSTAIYYGRWDMARCFLEGGMNDDCTSEHYNDAFQVAIQRRNKVYADLLVEKGVADKTAAEQPYHSDRAREIIDALKNMRVRDR